ncbi:Xaa-Pro peptidase family protein [Ruminococcaceae bacterium OttesenSCG-928-I18]|nr:Xaa-Pro peptidase family protein [Ruminococcaceae bacterium OttesenSCG-928-I18]
MLKKRVAQLLDAMPDDFEAALIQTEVSRFYFLDFDAADAGTLLLLPEKLVYLIDLRYIEAAEREIDNAEVVLEKDTFKQLGELLEKAGVKHLYLENRIPVSLYEKTREKLPQCSLNISGRLSEEIEALRSVKDESEIERMRRAQQITDACFAHILPKIQPGVREVDMMLEMERFMRSSGAEKVAFDTIFIGGANTSLPHGQPGEYRLQKGDFVTMDFGAKYRGYCSDMTRTVALGEPGEEKRKIYDLVLNAHYVGLKAVYSGQKGSAVDKAAREVIEQAGYGPYFGHGLGHAVGIEIHEAPRFSPKCGSVIRSGMMMTVEPGCYLPGRFGCRIEDTVLVKEDGCESLAASPKELLVL